MCLCVINNKNCSSVYYSVVIYIQIFIKMQFTYCFHGDGRPRARTWGGLRSSALLMSVQFQSLTPSVDPAVENYFCNTVHLE